jgi:molecular chaperone GrpE
MSRHRDKHDDLESPAAAVTDDISHFPPDAADMIQQLRAERDDAAAARLRALADFKNYQRRAIENEARASSSATAQVIRSLLPVLDHFEFAAQQDAAQMTAEQMASAMNILQQELMKALQTSGLRRIDPKPGDEFNPQEHEAILHQPNSDVAPGQVVAVYQTGYALGDLMLRPAKVIVASASAAE